LTVAFVLGGTATPGADFAALVSPVTIPASQASVTVTVTPLNDTTPERPESVVVTLVPGAGYTVGAQNSATVTIEDDDNLAPTVAISAPASGTVYPITPTNILLTATASDPDGGVSRVEYFWQGTNKIGEATAAPYAVTWNNTPSGSNAVVAVATDVLDKTSTSAPVFLVLNAAPSVAITSPTNNALFTIPATVVVTASAADSDGSVALVQFFEGANLLGSSTASPYSVVWNDPAEGIYSLTARATDNRGAVRVSSAVSVRIGSLPPTLEDFFANRKTVTVATNVVLGSNVGTSKETGEPNHANDVGGRSVWIAWTAPASATAVVDTIGSSFDTTLAVYTGNAVNSLNLIAANNNIGGGGNNRSRVTFDASAGTTYNIAVDGNAPFAGATPTGDIQLNFGMVIPLMPPVITAQPQGQSVSPGASVAFNVTATGRVPMGFQWRLNGVNLPGATTSTLTLNNVMGVSEGDYSVRITNADGDVVSVTARLTVNDGLFVTERTVLVPLSSTWRFDQAGIDRGGAWYQADYDDSGWTSGPALLGLEDTVPSPYPLPIVTALKPTSTGGPVTSYFRTRFNFAGASGALTLTSTNYVDDGAIYYINGTEAGRLRMSPGVTNFFALASSANPEGQAFVLNLATTNLLIGENVLAVEVHQSAFFDADIVFGMSLTAVLSSTNQPTLGNLQRLPNGSLQLTLSGIAGRNYALDVAPSVSGTWSSLTTFSNFTGQATYLDSNAGAAAPRFYRGRWVP
jgi:hypothetical protein